MPDPFDEKTAASIAASVRAGQYNVLLGSGVSLDCVNENFEPLPSGSDLRRDLCQLKDASPNASLPRVFSTLTPQEVTQHVTGRFAGARPGATVRLLTQFLWRRIFTFNIDGAVEAAYSLPNSLQRPFTYNFIDPYVENRDPETIPIVHLHGFVDRSDDRYVFSTAEYVQNINRQNPWMVNLSQFLRVEPFIIAGSSLDEIDLEYYLSFRTAATPRSDRGPSILVEPYPDAITRDYCEKHGLLLFEGKGHDFLAYLDKLAPDRSRAIGLVQRSLANLFPSETQPRVVSAFAADFELVPPNATAATGPSRFFYGHPPEWTDLAAGADIGRESTKEIYEAIATRLSGESNDGAIILLLDDTGSGKTTVTRRVAFDFATRGYNVLVCSPLSRLEPLPTATAIDLINAPLLVVVDDLGDQVSALSDIIRLLKKRNVVFFCAERKYRQRFLYHALAEHRVVKYEGLKLGARGAEQLVARLTEKGISGFDSATQGSRERLFSELAREPIAVATCRVLNNFRPLDRIVESIVKGASDAARERYLIAAIAQYCFPGGVRYSVLASACERDGWDEQIGNDHPLPLSYFDRNREFLIPLNATIAARVLEKSRPKDLLSAFVLLGNGISSRVNRLAIRSRAPEARLAGRLFDYDQVVTRFLRDEAAAFYAEMHAAWQWNSRYWEQVALMHLAASRDRDPRSDVGKHELEQALQYARHAALIEHHPLTLTTLSAVLLFHMSAYETASSEHYDEAFNNLAEAITMERTRSRVTVQPFMVLFRGTADFRSYGGKLTRAQVAKLREFAWDAKQRFPFDREVHQAIATAALETA